MMPIVLRDVSCKAMLSPQVTVLRVGNNLWSRMSQGEVTIVLTGLGVLSSSQVYLVKMLQKVLHPQADDLTGKCIFRLLLKIAAM